MVSEHVIYLPSLVDHNTVETFFENIFYSPDPGRLFLFSKQLNVDFEERIKPHKSGIILS